MLVRPQAGMDSIGADGAGAGHGSAERTEPFGRRLAEPVRSLIDVSPRLPDLASGSRGKIVLRGKADSTGEVASGGETVSSVSAASSGLTLLELSRESCLSGAEIGAGFNSGDASSGAGDGTGDGTEDGSSDASSQTGAANPSLLVSGAATVRSIFQRYGGEYLERMAELGIEVVDEQRKALWRLQSCKTSALGYHMWECVECGAKFTTYNACEDRHCPQCMEFKGDQWAADRSRELLPVPYYHVITTVPHEINVLLDVFANRSSVFGMVFLASREAVLQVAAEWSEWQASVGLLQVLHTWNQLMERHVHIHMLLPTVGWSIGDPERLAHAPEGVKMPEEWIGRVFRDRLMQLLRRALGKGELDLSAPSCVELGLDQEDALEAWLRKLEAKKWVIRQPPQIPSGEITVEYFSKYTQSVGIGNRRIQSIDLDSDTVVFSRRKNGGGEEGRDAYEDESIGGVEFVARFIDHILPSRFRKNRAAGWWGPRTKNEQIPKLRAALAKEKVQELASYGMEVDEKEILSEMSQPPPSESGDARSAGDEAMIQSVIAELKAEGLIPDRENRDKQRQQEKQEQQQDSNGTTYTLISSDLLSAEDVSGTSGVPGMAGAGDEFDESFLLSNDPLENFLVLRAAAVICPFCQQQGLYEVDASAKPALWELLQTDPWPGNRYMSIRGYWAWRQSRKPDDHGRIQQEFPVQAASAARGPPRGDDDDDPF